MVWMSVKDVVYQCQFSDSEGQDPGNECYGEVFPDGCF